MSDTETTTTNIVETTHQHELQAVGAKIITDAVWEPWREGAAGHPRALEGARTVGTIPGAFGVAERLELQVFRRPAHRLGQGVDHGARIVLGVRGRASLIVASAVADTGVDALKELLESDFAALLVTTAGLKIAGS